MRHEGVFIAFEGGDGSGKATQFERLAERLRRGGYDVATFDFPRYDQPSSYFVREYLAGNYGKLDEVGPYTASLFYAMDRYQASAEIRAALDEGKVVLTNRFTGSSMAHQGTKFFHAEQRRGFFIWLDNLEFQLLAIPRPDKNLVLRVPAGVADKLIDDRGKERDILEADPLHQGQVREVYDDLVQLFPKDFTRIDCVRSGKLLSVDQIHDMVWHSVEPLLPEPISDKPIVAKTHPTAPPQKKPAPGNQPSPGNHSLEGVSTLLALQYAHQADVSPVTDAKVPYIVPDGLDKLTLGKYQAAMDKIFEIHGNVLSKLQEHLAKESTTGTGAEEIARAVLPMAAKVDISLQQEIRGPVADKQLIETPNSANATQAFADKLPTNHSSPSEAVVLKHVWPRNELDIIPRILYSGSDQPLSEIEKHVSSWPIQQKAEALEAYLKGGDREALATISYTWEFLTDIGTLQAFSRDIGIQPAWQVLSPRFGYEVPEILDAAGVSEDYEKCFDLSAKLHSVLQEAGHTAEAQYAVLAGHRVRWSMTIPGSVSLPVHILSKDIREKQAEVHPVLSR